LGNGVSQQPEFEPLFDNHLINGIGIAIVKKDKMELNRDQKGYLKQFLPDNIL